MLYGKRPFGEGLSQERILREDVMLNARQVAFPAKPAVSQECKDFITRSVLQVFQDTSPCCSVSCAKMTSVNLDARRNEHANQLCVADDEVLQILHHLQFSLQPM